MAEAEPFHHPGSEGLDENVRRAAEAPQDLHTLRLLQVEGDGALAPGRDVVVEAVSHLVPQID